MGVAVDRVMRALKLALKLGRLKMTVFSAVTYGAAASIANLALVEAGAESEFDPGLFLAGWALVFFNQLVAHFMGEHVRTASGLMMNLLERITCSWLRRYSCNLFLDIDAPRT